MIIGGSISAVRLRLSVSLTAVRLSSVSSWLDGRGLYVDIIDVSSVLSDGLPDRIFDQPFGHTEHLPSAEEGGAIALIASDFQAALSPLLGPHVFQLWGCTHPAREAEETERDSCVA